MPPACGDKSPGEHGSPELLDAAEKVGETDKLARELAELFESQNRGSGGCTEIPATYLKVSVTKD